MAGLLDSASDRRFILARLETLPTSAVIEVGKRVTAGAAVHAIARILGDRGDPAGAGFLIGKLASEDAGVRAAAAESLGKLGDPFHATHLSERLREEQDEGVVQELIVALGALRHRAAAREVVRSLGSNSAVTRRCSARALGEMVDRSATEALAKAANAIWLDGWQ